MNIKRSGYTEICYWFDILNCLNLIYYIDEALADDFVMNFFV